MGLKNRRRRRNLSHSFSFQLILLALILLSVPLIIYWQFNRSDREKLVLLSNAVGQTNQVLAGMLRRHFEEFYNAPPSQMQEALANVAVGNTHIKILMRLAGTDNFLYVASSPSVSQAYLEKERRYFVQSGIFYRLKSSCDGTVNLNHKFRNPGGTEEMLTAMTPVYVGGDCWVVMTSKSLEGLAPSSSDLPFWERPVIRMAGAIYAVATILVIWLLFYMQWSMRRFRNVARHIRFHSNHELSFTEANNIPELAGVAEDFDALVDVLINSQRQIKETAEEKAHALKAPLAVIAQCVEPLKRALKSNDEAASRSIHLIERSINRLDALVSAYRNVEETVADLAYPANHSVNLTKLLDTMLPAYETVMVASGKHLIYSTLPDAIVRGTRELMEVVIENLLENAISFTNAGEAIEVTLYFEGSMVCLRVADNGPGVRPDKLPYIFDRATSFRKERSAAVTSKDPHEKIGHEGLGLWIVKRNVESLGGCIEARNSARGGFEITLCLQKGS